jgi:hypothetical protein
MRHIFYATMHIARPLDRRGRSMTRLRLTVVAALLTGVACTAEDPRGTEDQRLSVSNVGFQTPESVLHDSIGDVYLVSNINGNPLAVDGNGFISQLGPNGDVLALKWIDGESSGITLNAPKGMAISGDTLFVADITSVRLFDRTTGAPVGSWAIRGASFLNDVVVDAAGTVYVSDSGLRAGAGGLEPTGTDAVYRFDAVGTPVRLTAGATLGRPNGLAAAPERLILVSFGTGTMFHIDVESGQTSGLPSPPSGQLDGVVRLADGSILVSSWQGRAVYRMGPGPQFAPVVEDIEAPADIGYDHGRSRILIPMFTTDQVLIVPLPPSRPLR